MSLTARELNQLKKIVVIANQLIVKAEANIAAGAAKAEGAVAKTVKKSNAKASAKAAPKATAKKAAKEGKRMRRTGAELIAFRKMLVAERKRGTPVAELAKQHGVSAAYIYQL